MSADAVVQRLWYGPAWLSLPLWPLAWLFRAVVALRRELYRLGLLRTHFVGVPVIVVGNVTVGGTGKTPVAAWLAHELGLRGRRVGVVLRGYRGRHPGRARRVSAADAPVDVGDEALVHVARGPHVVAIGADRVAAARLAAEDGAEVIVCDDGLQHLRLARDCEIAVVDAERGFGNGRMLPAGPLREPPSRIERTHAVVLTARGRGTRARMELGGPRVVHARFRLGDAVNLVSGERRALAAFTGKAVHALAAIGHPQAFFAGLRDAGLDVVARALPDHASLDPSSLPLPADATVLMTEKDAVKCQPFARPGWWFVELGIHIDRAEAAALLDTVIERTDLAGAGVKLG